MASNIVAKCCSCSEDITSSEEFLLCRGKCASHYHLRCTDVSAANYKKISKANKNSWECNRCKQSKQPKKSLSFASDKKGQDGEDINISSTSSDATIEQSLPARRDGSDFTVVNTCPNESVNICPSCLTEVKEKAWSVLGKVWHFQHFVCSICGSNLAYRAFFQTDDGKLYCENDYYRLCYPFCAECNQIIVDKYITALDKFWHPDHFLCAQCGGSFPEEGYYEKDGKAYCKQDYIDLFAPKCGGCGYPIIGVYLSSLDKSWHIDCFRRL